MITNEVEKEIIKNKAAWIEDDEERYKYLNLLYATLTVDAVLMDNIEKARIYATIANHFRNRYIELKEWGK